MRAPCILVGIQLNQLYEGGGLNLAQLLGQFGAPFLTTRPQDGRLLDERATPELTLRVCVHAEYKESCAIIAPPAISFPATVVLALRVSSDMGFENHLHSRK